MTPLLSFFARTALLRFRTRFLGFAAKLGVSVTLLGLFLLLGFRFAEARTELVENIHDAGADVVRMFWYSPPEGVPNTLADFVPAGRDDVVAYSVLGARCLDKDETSLPVVMLEPATARRLGVDAGRKLLFIKERDGMTDEAMPIYLNRASVMAGVMGNVSLRRCLPYDRALITADAVANSKVTVHCLAFPVGSLDAKKVRDVAEGLRAVSPRGVIVKDNADMIDRLDALVLVQNSQRAGAAAGIAIIIALVFASQAAADFDKYAKSVGNLRQMGARPVVIAILETYEPFLVLSISFGLSVLLTRHYGVYRTPDASEWNMLLGTAVAIAGVTFFSQWRMISAPVGLLMKR